MTKSKPDTTPIHSEFADDPDMCELTEAFLEEMEGRIDTMERAWKDGETASLGRLAHQLKGAGGGYGFPTISEAAGRLEAAIDGCKQIESIEYELMALLDICRRASA